MQATLATASRMTVARAQRIFLASIALTLVGGTGAYALPPGYKTYLFSEVRPHQFVEVWPTFKPDKGIHIQAKLSNGRRVSGNFYAILILYFVDDKGKELARHVSHLEVGDPFLGRGKDRYYDFDIPNPQGLDIWTSSAAVRAGLNEDRAKARGAPQLIIPIPLDSK